MIQNDVLRLVQSQREEMEIMCRFIHDPADSALAEKRAVTLLVYLRRKTGVSFAEYAQAIAQVYALPEREVGMLTERLCRLERGEAQARKDGKQVVEELLEVAFSGFVPFRQPDEVYFAAASHVSLSLQVRCPACYREYAKFGISSMRKFPKTQDTPKPANKSTPKPVPKSAPNLATKAGPVAPWNPDIQRILEIYHHYTGKKHRFGVLGDMWLDERKFLCCVELTEGNPVRLLEENCLTGQYRPAPYDVEDEVREAFARQFPKYFR